MFNNKASHLISRAYLVLKSKIHSQLAEKKIRRKLLVLLITVAILALVVAAYLIVRSKISSIGASLFPLRKGGLIPYQNFKSISPGPLLTLLIIPLFLIFLLVALLLALVTFFWHSIASIFSPVFFLFQAKEPVNFIWTLILVVLIALTAVAIWLQLRRPSHLKQSKKRAVTTTIMLLLVAIIISAHLLAFYAEPSHPKWSPLPFNHPLAKPLQQSPSSIA